MPQPLLDFLTGRARQALPFLRQLVSEGLEPTVIISELREYNLGFQTQRVLDVIAALYGRANVARWIRLVGANTALPPEAHTTNVAGQSTNYQYVVRVENAPVGVPEFLTVSSDIPLSWNSIQSKALIAAIVSGPPKSEEEDFEDITFVPIEANVSVAAPKP